LGTTYKRTGLHFDKRLEKMTNDIHYFKKNEKLSFHTDDENPVNKLIIGDNFQALQNLLIRYKGKINVIYIDPPYGKDSMGEFAKTNYNNSLTRDNLLSMLYPRLHLAKQLLSDDGVIFCSIDDKNQAYVKCLFDEVFGEENFIGTLKWKKKKQPSFASNHIAGIIEYILLYAKDESQCGKFSVENISDSTKKIINIYNPITERIFNAGVEVKGLENGIITKGKYLIKTMEVEYLDDILVENFRTKNSVKVKARFLNTQEKIDYFISEKLLYITEKKGLRRYVSNEELNNQKAITDLLLNNGDNQESEKEISALFGNKMFDFAKPSELIKYLIESYDSTSAETSIVLDFFAGSGTTGQAVLDLNKKDGSNRMFILCQLNENLDETLKNTSETNQETIKNQVTLCNKIKRPHELSEITCERLRRIQKGESLDGTKDFDWLKKNEPYGGNLDVYEIANVANFETTQGKTPFDVIDETLYGKEKFSSAQEKIDWVCSNFEKTQKVVK
jgi:adenine-specific DNA-methyltransferase